MATKRRMPPPAQIIPESNDDDRAQKRPRAGEVAVVDKGQAETKDPVAISSAGGRTAAATDAVVAGLPKPVVLRPRQPGQPELQYDPEAADRPISLGDDDDMPVVTLGSDGSSRRGYRKDRVVVSETSTVASPPIPLTSPAAAPAPTGRSAAPSNPSSSSAATASPPSSALPSALPSASPSASSSAGSSLTRDAGAGRAAAGVAGGAMGEPVKPPTSAAAATTAAAVAGREVKDALSGERIGADAFRIRAIQSGVMSRMFKCLQHLLQDGRLFVKRDRLHIGTMDSGHVCFCEVRLYAGFFDSYRVARPITLGFKMATLIKVLKCQVTSEDILTMSARDDTEWQFVFEPTHGRRVKTVGMKLMTIDEDEQEPEHTDDPSATFVMVASEFKKICVELKNMMCDSMWLVGNKAHQTITIVGAGSDLAAHRQVFVQSTDGEGEVSSIKVRQDCSVKVTVNYLGFFSESCAVAPDVIIRVPPPRQTSCVRLTSSCSCLGRRSRTR
jgi:proliferating cell nuclear antigen PCNA